MKMPPKYGILAAATALWLLPQAALAQTAQNQQPQQQAQDPVQQQQQGQQQQGQQVAEQCLQRLQQAAMRMQEDQFWLMGWGRGYGTQTVAPGATDPAMQPAPGAGTTGMTGGAGTVGTGAAGTGATGMAPMAGDPLTGDPRGTAEGIYSPREQIRTLYFAAQVLAQRGEEEGCDYVAGQLETIYAGYGEQLEAAGVDPAQVTDWRQEQLALAQPIHEMQGMRSYRIDNITGTDVRNVQDENLGSVHDVIIDPSTGAAAYILVARGGFLGFGEDYVAVPWQQLNATPGLETIVLNVSQADLDQAPSVDPDRFRDPVTMDQERGTVDQFWATDRG